MTEEENDEPIRDFVDRALREQLQQPEILAEFLREAAPVFAADLLFEQMRPAPQEFLVGNFRQRAPDILVEVPFRTTGAPALVCVLVEHQSRTERLIPIKLHLYQAKYWEWQWRTWETLPTPREAFRITPVFPVVLHTGPRPWGSARHLRELAAPPELFHRFVTNIEPVFWDLAEHPIPQLLQANAPFLQMLTILKADGQEFAAAIEIFTAVFRRLDELHDTRSTRWADAVKFLMGWAHHKRPTHERKQWHESACNMQATAERRREIEHMGETIAQAIYKEGRQEGLTVGRQEGLTEGRQRLLTFARQVVLKQGKPLFGQPSPTIQLRIDTNDNDEQLARWIDQLTSVKSWDELIAIP